MEKYNVATKGMILNNDNKVLILQRANDDEFKPSIWELPGGNLEKHESEKDGLKREIMEETGLKIDIINVLDSRSFMKKEKFRLRIITFLCKAKTTNIVLSYEHKDFAWVDVKTAKKKVEYFDDAFNFYNKIKIYI